jgi:ABC-type antimicrobial peptide transport system permease subunit
MTNELPYEPHPLRERPRWALALATVGCDAILFGVSARDPLTFGVVVSLVALVSSVAIWFPARRATRVDPMIALRTE